jgi:C1A family cysteine protease
MMNEIYHRGPIACGMSVTAEFKNYSGGIFIDRTNNTNITHDVAIVGWGEEDGVKYWLGRNSWGTYWVENTFVCKLNPLISLGYRRLL